MLVECLRSELTCRGLQQRSGAWRRGPLLLGRSSHGGGRLRIGGSCGRSCSGEFQCGQGGGGVYEDTGAACGNLATVEGAQRERATFSSGSST